MAFQMIEGGVCAAKGFSAAGIHCGIRPNKQKPDLAMIMSERPCSAAAIYTQNKVKGAPIIVTQRHLADGQAHAVICNSGNANTCNADGEFIAGSMCEALAKAMNIDPEDVIVASTGVIGQPLPLEPIVSHMAALRANLGSDADASSRATRAIMTTDTREKSVAVRFELDGKQCTVGGICKGSGMIHPNMATMLCFLTTDVDISPELLDVTCHEIADQTFNMISVDGDTSTNDMLAIMANGAAGNTRLRTADNKQYNRFWQAMFVVCRQLSRMMAADGEGATKLLECNVNGAPDTVIAKSVAKSVVCSTLFKAAMFGEDANWGRVLCAIGYAPGNFDIGRIGVRLSNEKGTVQVCERGAGMDFSEELASKILAENEIIITVEMNQGAAQATAWGCDLSYDYVKINGSYRT